MSRTFISDSRKRVGFLVVFAIVIALVATAIAYTHDASVTAQQISVSEQPNGVSVLLTLADTAYHERRIMAPAGSNMYEFYLSLLELDPTNQVARARMLSEFQPSSHEVERVISTGDLDEAERELRLLHDYSQQQQIENDSYKLALLGSYLYAQRNLLSRTHETQARQLHDSRAAQAAP